MASRSPQLQGRATLVQNGVPGLTYFRGRVALAVALKGLRVGRGDEVAVQAFTCLAVPEAVLGVGATPRYVDTEPGGFTMDPSDLARKLTTRVRAVVVQYTFGIPADLPAILSLTAARDIPLIEDCAHTIASRLGVREVGAFGVAGFYSYEASKPVFAGIGGSLRVNDPALAARVRADYAAYAQPAPHVQLQLLAMFVAHRLLYRPSAYWTIRAVFRRLVALGLIKGNYNAVGRDVRPADDFTRAMGSVQRRTLAHALRSLERQTEHRRKVAQAYRTRIDSPAVRHPDLAPLADPVFGRYPLLSERKVEVVERARAARVELAEFYATPVHPLRGSGLAAVNYEAGSCPQAEHIAERVVSLPTSEDVGMRQIERAVAFFNALG